MLQRYLSVNERARKWLWWVVILGLLASVPLAYERVNTERSTKNVDIVFDYRDLLESAAYKPNPEAYIQEWLQTMKGAGIESMAVYESSLEELKNSRRIQVYNAQEYSLLTGTPIVQGENNTYLLFASQEAKDKLQPIMERTYRDRVKAKVTTWTHNNRQGLIIGLPYEEANTKPMEPDPIAMDMLQKQGFRIVARLSDRMQPYSESELEDLLKKLSQRGVNRIVFDGTAVTGYDEDPEKNNVPKTAELMKKYGMGTAAIERLKVPQKGFTVSFADRLDNNVVRLFPLFETEANLKPEQIADKLVLAVKDRNMRMLFLNTRTAKDMDKGFMNDYLENIITGLNGPEGAVKRIEAAGYQLGEAHPFVEHGKVLEPLKLVLLVGGAALIALTIGLFLPALVTASFGIGTVGVLGLFVLSKSLALQAMAFGVGVCAPTLATILAIRYIQKRKTDRPSLSWIGALMIFLGTSLVTVIGVMYVVGLLSGITYYLVLEQYRGVGLLHLLPIFLVGLYALLFAESNGLRDVWERARQLLFAKITVIWIVLAAVFGGVIYYYLTRTGNEGQASQMEMLMRTYLENGLGVRPRFKEFIFAHPVFILAAYMYVKHRSAIFLFAGAVMGQLSIVDTFAHLHTPLYISAIRVGYGIVFGVVISLIYVAAWEVLARGWRRWGPK
ncbi:DUF5693 family protein [Paenibacillus sp. GYB004]|uniref:DUF5693 family protein n=1 Tax=Paenibacillus sp. GYB004 TaxID=2994393 RepID=UPI002F9692D9